jgi:hypothetical protein
MFAFIFYVLGSIACLIYIADNWQRLKNAFRAVSGD